MCACVFRLMSSWIEFSFWPLKFLENSWILFLTDQFSHMVRYLVFQPFHISLLLLKIFLDRLGHLEVLTILLKAHYYLTDWRSNICHKTNFNPHYVYFPKLGNFSELLKVMAWYRYSESAENSVVLGNWILGSPLHFIIINFQLEEKVIKIFLTFLKHLKFEKKKTEINQDLSFF